jgi:hypothetical protein
LLYAKLAGACISVFASVCGAVAEDQTGGTYAFDPQSVFFMDYYLFAARREITTMPDAERIALGEMLAVCPGTLILPETLRLRCELALQRFLMRHRRTDKYVYRVLQSAQFMRTLSRYNLIIGRESEAGIDSRLAVITTGLATALRQGGPARVMRCFSLRAPGERTFRAAHSEAMHHVRRGLGIDCPDGSPVADAFIFELGSSQPGPQRDVITDFSDGQGVVL